MALFENYEGRMPQLQPVLEKYGFKDFEEVKAYTNGKGVDAYSIVESTQPICFENVKWAYELGAAIAMKENAANAAEKVDYYYKSLADAKALDEAIAAEIKRLQARRKAKHSVSSSRSMAPRLPWPIPT